MGEDGCSARHPDGTAKEKSPALKDDASSASARQADNTSRKPTRGARMA
jgi:hypothetical protein